MTTAEHRRLRSAWSGAEDWYRWGPYLAERAWGTVREDYSEDGDAWAFLPHDHARSRAYRWNEDGLAGISDRNQYLCVALALWNGRDPFLKERLFGLSNPEGNHGEDVKECYFYVDATPTHSYLRMRYLYPHAEFPYADLVRTNAARGRAEPEYELEDTGVFAADRYFDVDVVYAKAGPADICLEITVTNRGPDEAELTVLPTVWCRNTWSWGYPAGPMRDVEGRPRLHAGDGGIEIAHPAAGRHRLYLAEPAELIFTENETNRERVFATPNPSPYTKDAFHRYVVDGDRTAVNPNRIGTKAGAVHRTRVPGGGEWRLRARLVAGESPDPFGDFDDVVALRRAEADEFHQRGAARQPELRAVQRQAAAGLIWSKQLYYYDIEQWLDGDPSGPSPPPGRRAGRNRDWRHLNNFDVISMPDAWEYPWYAAWDLAFHCVAFARIDPGFAKDNLSLLTRVWYMHGNGQMPAYEWGLGNVSPPVFAWAARRVFELDAVATGEPDHEFLEGMFHKLLINFTWWVNQKDADGNNVFQGGFLGLDNISVFDRSTPLPTGGHLDQSDGTAWMAFYTLGMLRIALELARLRPVYQEVATKFYEHFLAIARAMNLPDHNLWDAADGFFYDVVHLPDGRVAPLRVRSLVGLIALIGVEVIDDELLDAVPDFSRRMEWFAEHRSHLARNISTGERPGTGRRHLMAIIDSVRLRRVLRYVTDPDEFLSRHGIRSLSRAHRAEPFRFDYGGGEELVIGYEPGESETGLFGGNSNWRGPVWFPLNFLIIEALREYHDYYGERFTVPFPHGSGREATLAEVADDLAARLIGLFVPDEAGARPAYGTRPFYDRPGSDDLILFHEYFHAETGRGLGASHQTGWTALVANLIDELSD